jgi:hypothetical protein
MTYLSEMDIPENYEFRDYTYDLWKAYTDEGMARIEAAGVRSGYAERMYGVNRACVKRWNIDGVDVWCVYARYCSW